MVAAGQFGICAITTEHPVASTSSVAGTFSSGAPDIGSSTSSRDTRRRSSDAPKAVGASAPSPDSANPVGSKDEKVGWSTMNARSETAAVKPAFKTPFARRQWCILPAWEIFEPFHAPGAKRSECWGIERADGTALCIAGLWERWKSPEGSEVVSFAMLTINCDAHPLLARFHKHFDDKGEPNERRTPALLREEDYDR